MTLRGVIGEVMIQLEEDEEVLLQREEMIRDKDYRHPFEATRIIYQKKGDNFPPGIN